MGRVINTSSAGKRRNQLRRTIAELLRRLAQKKETDADTQNMVALIVLCLQEIDDGIDDSVRAWEKRGYWMKADAFRQEWMWVREMADRLTTLLLEEHWEDLPSALMELFPYFADINVAKFTRSSELWKNAYVTLMDKHNA